MAWPLARPSGRSLCSAIRLPLEQGAGENGPGCGVKQSWRVAYFLWNFSTDRNTTIKSFCRRGAEMHKTDTGIHSRMEIPKLTERRNFLTAGALMMTTLVLSPLFGRSAFAAGKHRYKLAPESILPADIRPAPDDVREAYRFAITNRATLRYIPCYCGCGAQGHTSNASCYIRDNSIPKKLIFDRMSLG